MKKEDDLEKRELTSVAESTKKEKKAPRGQVALTASVPS